MIDHLSTVGNKSEYIRNLIQSDMHKETRFAYTLQAVTKMVLAETRKRTPDTLIISTLAVMLANQITGTDQLNTVMEMGEG